MNAVSLTIAIVLAIILFIFGHPWLAIVSLMGPVVAVLVTMAGISGSAMLVLLSAGGSIPMVAGLWFIVIICLGIYSFFI